MLGLNDQIVPRASIVNRCESSLGPLYVQFPVSRSHPIASNETDDFWLTELTYFLRGPSLACNQSRADEA
eukprot:1470288-Pleurochrysis_carterae.AAC.2